jgi:hypothetical protein
MRSIILSVVLICATHVSFAEDKTPVKAADQNQEYVQMHEKMATAHQQAADCLKSGKSEDECRKAFHEMCKGSGGSEKCGQWMMHHKMWKKSK